MIVFNIMLSKGLGGIEQAFLDYNNALNLLDNLKVINITTVNGKINKLLDEHNIKETKITYFSITNFGKIDIFSPLYLRYLIAYYKPKIIFAHGRRAIDFANFFRPSSTALVAISHNYNIKSLSKTNHIIALTNHMKQFILHSKIFKNKIKDDKITVIPNMIDINDSLQRDFESNHYITSNREIYIGAMARFVSKKGLDILLKAVNILKYEIKQNNFRLLIAGDGEEKEKLLKLSKKLNIDNITDFIGWINKKEDFFKKIDIFCLPSLHEPFGIVLLEAMKYQIPVIASNTEGPNEIIKDGFNGILYEKYSYQELAKKLNYMILNNKNMHHLTKNAFTILKENYTKEKISAKLMNLISKLT